MAMSRLAKPQVGLCTVLVVAVMSTLPSTALAQGACDEPQDDVYVERMTQAAEALSREDYETALEHFFWASENYQYVVLEYGIARGLHRLERFDEAEQSYTRFLRQFDGCPDPDNLAANAREYRTLAIREQAARLEAETPEPQIETTTDDGAIHPGWFVIGGGGLLIITGLLIDVANQHLLEDRQAADDAGNDTEFFRIQDEIEDVQVAEAVLFGSGCAAAVTGLILLLVFDNDASESQMEVGWFPTQEGGLLSFSARF